MGQVALGAISEADRHNIRGERISVDTIPLVGEEPSPVRCDASSVAARSACWCWQGPSWAARSQRPSMKLVKGLYVISLNMAAACRTMPTFVVSDPGKAGVMAVMAVADTAVRHRPAAEAPLQGALHAR